LRQIEIEGGNHDHGVGIGERSFEDVIRQRHARTVRPHPTGPPGSLAEVVQAGASVHRYGGDHGPKLLLGHGRGVLDLESIDDHAYRADTEGLVSGADRA